MSINKGEGDGCKFVNKKRVPVPSSRKFTATAKSQEEASKRKLELILKEMTKSKTPKNTNCTLEKPRSLAEETPTKTKKKGQTDLNVSLYGTPREIPAKVNKKQAGHIILHQLLINSWRISKTNIQEKNQTIAKLKNLILQSKMQIDVLKSLQKSESQKREELNVKFKELKQELEQTTQGNDILNEQKMALRLENNNLRNCIKSLESQSQNLDNYKQKYDNKKQEAISLFEEKRCFEEQCVLLKQKIKIIKDDYNKIDIKTKHLENAMLQSKTENKMLSEKLKDEIEKQHLLQTKIKQLEDERQETIYEVNILKDQIERQINKNKALEDMNASTKECLLNLSSKLEEEQNKNIWNIIRQLAFSSYSILKTVSRIMLPALPHH